MLTVDLGTVGLVEETSEHDPVESLRYAFPLSSVEGTASTAAVYFELEPGRRLARHRDSAEEVLVILEGRAEAIVGSERTVAGAGTLVVVPAMEPHEVVNVGDGVLRVLGVFSSSTVVATFGDVEEGGAETFVVGAPVPIAVPVTAAAEA